MINPSDLGDYVPGKRIGERISLAEAFAEIVYPAAAAHGLLPRGRLMHTEGTTEDMMIGTDWMIQERDGTGHTVASRISWGPDMGTFTPRYRRNTGTLSEIPKIVRSIAAGGAYPTWTVQAYVDRELEILRNAYVVRTKELYTHIAHPVPGEEVAFTFCGCVGRRMTNPRDGAQWFPVAVTEEARGRLGTKSTLIACGVPVGIVMPVATGRGLGL